MITLNSFKAKSERSKVKDAAIGVGSGVGISGLVGAGLYAKGVNNRINQAKRGVELANQGLETAKQGMRKYHPDRVAGRFDNQILQKGIGESTTKKFKEYEDLKSTSKKLLEEFEPDSKKTFKQVVKDDAKVAGKAIKNKLSNIKQATLKNKGKLGIAAVGTLATGALINKLRKARSDKGRTRGKYNTN